MKAGVENKAEQITGQHTGTGTVIVLLLLNEPPSCLPKYHKDVQSEIQDQEAVGAKLVLLVTPPPKYVLTC